MLPFWALAAATAGAGARASALEHAVPVGRPAAKTASVVPTGPPQPAVGSRLGAVACRSPLNKKNRCVNVDINWCECATT